MKKLSVWLTRRKGKRGMSYVVRWREPDSGIIRAKSFKRLEDSREFQGKLIRDIKNNDYHTPVNVSFDEWKKNHLANLRNSPDFNLAPKTIDSHEEALNALGSECNPKRPLDIDPAMILVFRRKQLKHGLAAATINKRIATIRSALSYAQRAKIVPYNKLLGPQRLLLETEEKPLRIVEVGEAIALMNVTSDLRQRVVIALAFYSGMRRGEICFLQWQDVDFDDCRLDVVHRKEKRNKTKRSRSVALREETLVMLRELKRQQVNKWVFEEPSAFYWSVSVWFPELVEKAELDPFTLHDLRKTCNTLLQDTGTPQEVAMQILGHTTQKVNRKHYTGYLTEQQRKAVGLLPSIG